MCIFALTLTSQEGLLERQEFLQWILELLDKMRSSPADDGILKLLLPLALQYLDEFVQSELLARKLAYLCAKKLAQLCSVATDTAGAASALSSSPVLPPSASPQSPLLPGNM
jgi:mediator of RNA polymerase II transcription subunit 12